MFCDRDRVGRFQHRSTNIDTLEARRTNERGSRARMRHCRRCGSPNAPVVEGLMPEPSSLNDAVGYTAQQKHPAFETHDPHELILGCRLTTLKVDNVA